MSEQNNQEPQDALEAGSLHQRAASLFNLLDPQGTGFVNIDDLRAIAAESTDDEQQQATEEIFRRFDTNGDGRINLADFQIALTAISCRAAEAADIGQDLGHEVPIIDGAEELECHDEVQQMQRLLAQNYPQLAESFQGVIATVATELAIQRREHQELETSYRRSRDLANQRARQLQEEMERQLSGFERQARLAERQRLEAEFHQLANRQQDEISRLQARMSELRRHRDSAAASSSLASSTAAAAAQEAAAAAKSDADRLVRETQQLEAELAACQAKLSRARNRGDAGELALKSQRRQVAEETERRQELDGRLAEMRLANLRLRQANEDLRRALFNGGRLQRRIRRHRLREASGMSASSMLRKSTTSADIPAAFGGCEFRDSEDSEWEAETGASTTTARLSSAWRLDANEQTLPLSSPSEDSTTIASSDEADEIDDEGDTDLDEFSADEDVGVPLADELAAAAPPPAPPSRYRRRRRARTSRRRRLPWLASSGVVEADFDFADVADQQPERLFKIVTAGDAAVGKSSFVGCFCDGRCPQSTVATVGIDFRTRTLAVDGRVVAIQLWDTAGQERFRSLARSYFRRADGALLIYDCTDEASFVGVRDWLLAIRESSGCEIPVLLLANKIDARDAARDRGSAVVDTEAGRQLSSDCGALFAEASAATGQNVAAAVATLTRVLLLQQDLAVGNCLSIHLRRRPSDGDVTGVGSGSSSAVKAWHRRSNCCRNA